MASPLMSQLARGREDRVHNLLVARTAAEIPRECLPHLSLRRGRVVVKVSFCRENHGWDAVTALHRTVIDEGLLERMEPAVTSQSLDRQHFPPLTLRGEEDARVHRSAIQEDRADATFCLEAVLLRSGQA